MPVINRAGRQRVRTGAAGRQQCRSGVKPPTGTIHPRQVFAWVLTLYLLLPVLKEFVPALPVVKESGPALPVGNNAGRGFHPRPERSTPAKYLLGFSLSTFYCRWSKSSSLPVVKESVPALPVINNAGRGLHPRPERSTPAKYSPTLPNSSPPSPCKSSYFCPLSSALAWVDRSGRGFNPRPAQGRNAPPLLVAGVKPPTGTKSERSPSAGCVGYNPRPAQSRNAPPLLVAEC